MLAVLPLPAAAAQPVPLVGFLSGASQTGYERFATAFREGLADQGYVDGRNIRIDYRWAGGHPERLPGLAADLVKEHAAVLAAAGGPAAALAAKAATATVPIVFLSGSDPIAQGLVTSLSRPTGNLTGFTFFAAELAPKRLQLLRQLLDRPATIAVLENPKGRDGPPGLRAVQTAAARLGQQLLVQQASAADQLDRALTGEHRIATICPGDAYATSCVVTYGPDLAKLYRAMGRYAGKILAGARPADLPVQRADEPKLVINLEIAKALGLAVPPSVLGGADELIQ